MSQNRSNAVMATRVEAPDSLDFFPTPPWATRALIEHAIVGHGWRKDNLSEQTVWEPACGEGNMARPLAEYFKNVRASDVHPYGFGTVADFLFEVKTAKRPDWIITNPPFRLAMQFIVAAKASARQGVAMLVRTSFLESGERYRELFKPHPPLFVAPFVERVPMLKGRLDRKASSATSYTWIIWGGTEHIRFNSDARMVWIPPCRGQLERDSDYDLALRHAVMEGADA